MFLVKNGDNPISNNKHRCQIKYLAVDDYASKQDKLNLLSKMAVQIANNVSLRTYREVIEQKFNKITPSKQYQWLGQVENDWQNLVPLISKDCKNNKTGADAIFTLYSLGVATNRDKWVYDINKKNLAKKVEKFIEIYHQELEKNDAEIIRINALKKSHDGKKNQNGELTP
jgi:predicted helicase